MPLIVHRCRTLGRVNYRSDAIVVGGGIAGICAALELLEGGMRVLLLDRDEETAFGGLAREAFGGIFVVGSPEQRRAGFRDTPEAALAMGANRWQTVHRVLVPAARNGLLAAVLLGVGRAVGETMAVLMATGHAVHVPHSLLDSVRTLTANIAAELGEAAAGSDHYRVLFLTGTLLFAITFVVNLGADLAIRGVRKR